jgi:hypothetical protein
MLNFDDHQYYAECMQARTALFVRSERCNTHHDVDDEEQNLAANTEKIQLENSFVHCHDVAILRIKTEKRNVPVSRSLSLSLGLSRHSPPRGPSKEVCPSLASLGLSRHSPPQGPSKDVRLSLPLCPSLGLGRQFFPSVSILQLYLALDSARDLHFSPSSV